VAAEVHPHIQAFTIGFAGDGPEVARSDESVIAEQVARHVGARHHLERVDPSSLLALLDDGFMAMDEPVADPAVLPLLVMARFARRHVKVVLTGDGGDELFGGYLRQQLVPWKRRWLALPSAMQSVMTGVAGRLPSAPSGGAAEVMRRVRVGVDLLAAPE